MIYLGTKLEVATSNGLGGDTFTRNVTDGRTRGRTTDRLWYEIKIPFFSKEKSGYDKCVLLKDHNAVTPVRLEPAAPRSGVKHSTTEPLRSQPHCELCISSVEKISEMQITLHQNSSVK